MSAFTSLTIHFTKPDGTLLVVTSPDVALGAAVDDPDLGPLAANEYMVYTTEAGDIDQVGVWRACGVYVDAAPSNFPSDTSTFTVEAGCP